MFQDAKKKWAPIQMRIAIHVVHSAIVESRLPHVARLIEILTSSGLFDSIRDEVVAVHEPGTISAETIATSTDFSKIEEGTGLEAFNSAIRPLHIRNVSNLLNHVEALRRVSKDEDGKEFHLVIEDDVVFGDKVADALVGAIEALPVDGDGGLMFLGLPSAQREGEDEDNKSPAAPFFKFYNVAPSCDSYLVTPAAARKLLEPGHVLPIKFPTNFQLSYALSKSGVATRFSRPNVFIDGSKFGVFTSSIEANNTLMMSSEHMILAECVERNDLDGARSAYSTLRFRAHPDTMGLLAEIEHRHGNYVESKALFEACYRAYKDQSCVLTSASGFMQKYIAACKDFTRA